MGPQQGRRRLAGGCLLLCCGLLLTGCSINPRVDLTAVGAGTRSSVTLDVPFFAQTENQCGPAALATVLSASGVDTSPELLSPQVYLPERAGSLQVELVAATRRAGRVPFVPGSDLESLLAELDRNRPVLMLQNLGTPNYPVWHYAVLTAYDRSRNALRLNSGERRDLWRSAPQLLRTWDWGGRWALVALRPGELPAVAEAEADLQRFFQSLADFERVAGAEAGLPSWRAAAERWPGRTEPLLALGNLAYQRQRLAEAAEYYQRGLGLAPDDPALANNLASVLGEAGCARRGEAVLRSVAGRLDSASPWAAPIAATLEELSRQRLSDPLSCSDFGVLASNTAARPADP